MTTFRPITGKPCDSNHPYPTPDEHDHLDSVEYGELERTAEGTMYDRNPIDAWRLVAANMWEAECRNDHVAEVAQDPILTTYIIAACKVAYPPENADPVTQLGLGIAGDVFRALQAGGLEAGREKVDAMPADVRRKALVECAAHINHGFTALRLDLEPAVTR